MSRRGMSKKLDPVGAGEPGEALHDVRPADAFALGHPERRERKDGLRLMPGGQGVRHVATHDEGQLVLGPGLMQPSQRIDRVGPRRHVGFDS